MDLPSKWVAIALEAQHAAKLMAESPSTVRGGPWLSPRPLGKQDLAEVHAVAGCKNLLAVKALADENPEAGMLVSVRVSQRHLCLEPETYTQVCVCVCRAIEVDVFLAGTGAVFVWILMCGLGLPRGSSAC